MIADFLPLFYLLLVVAIGTAVLGLIGSLPSYLYEKINDRKDRKTSVEDKITLQIKMYKPSHSDHLTRQAEQEHELGLHDDAMRKKWEEWDHDTSVMLADVGDYSEVKYYRAPERGCSECDRVKAGELCLCSQCMPLWAGKRVA